MQAELRDCAACGDLPRGFWLPWSVGVASCGIRTVLAISASEMVEEDALASSADGAAAADGAVDGGRGAEEGEAVEETEAGEAEDEEEEDILPPSPPSPPPATAMRRGGSTTAAASTSSAASAAATASACTALVTRDPARAHAHAAAPLGSAAAAAECGACRFCLDKPKFGGGNKLRRACERRQPPPKRRRAASAASAGSGTDRASVGSSTGASGGTGAHVGRVGGAGLPDGVAEVGDAARQKRQRAGGSLADGVSTGGSPVGGSSAADGAGQAAASLASATAPTDEFAPPPKLPGLYQRIEDCDAEAFKRIVLARMDRQLPITFQMLEEGFLRYPDLKR